VLIKSKTRDPSIGSGLTGGVGAEVRYYGGRRHARISSALAPALSGVARDALFKQYLLVRSYSAVGRREVFSVSASFLRAR
jgi:hypothetical protein